MARLTLLDVEGLHVEVQRKAIKNMYLRVYPPDGRVRVTAPLRASDRAVLAMVAGRQEWIQRHQERCRRLVPHTAAAMTTGEAHAFLGCMYPLQRITISGKPRIELTGGTLVLFAPEGTPAVACARVLENWYRRELQEVLPTFLVPWQEALHVATREWRIRKMKSRWGSCSPASARLCFNLELIKNRCTVLSMWFYMSWHTCWNVATMTASRRFWTGTCHSGAHTGKN